MARLVPRQIVFRLPLVSALSRPTRIGAAEFDPESLRASVYPPIPITWERLHLTPTGIAATFLNVTREFSPNVDWGYMGSGRLWNYHLHYLSWLHNPTCSPGLLEDYLHRGQFQGSAPEPYPTSLRIINVIKAIASGNVGATPVLAGMLRSDARRLARNVEYHLMGNHLLENGFALLWAGHVFNHPRLKKLGRTITASQLREQILPDGAHFERSPMYHSIILWRLLDTINLFGTEAGDPIVPVLIRRARAMAGYLGAYPFDHERGHVNDSAPDMAPSAPALIDYASHLVGHIGCGRLHESGFRILNGKGDRLEGVRLLIDAGSVGPWYIPGHAHACTLAFELHDGAVPVLVDTGTSTYEPGNLRSYERSTSAHNTVTVGRRNSSEVWGAFRVARRANACILDDGPDRLAAIHDGYRSRFGVEHRRAFTIGDDHVRIQDDLITRRSRSAVGVARFIVHPDVSVRQVSGDAYRLGRFLVQFSGARGITERPAHVAGGFNVRRSSVSLDVRFERQLTTTITYAE